MLYLSCRERSIILRNNFSDVLILNSLKTVSAYFFLVLISLSTGALQAAESTSDPFIAPPNPLSGTSNQESDYTGWSLNVDNDLFTGGSRDRDYTGGIAVSVSGARTRDWVFSLDNARATLARLSGFERLFKHQTQLSQHTIEFGLALFTPSDISIPEPISFDRPYASLFFIANAAQYIVPERKLSFQSVFTVGALGLPLADTVQSGIHNVIGSELPEGWDNQISDGGEPTARFSLSVQKTLLEGGGPGLSTQVSVSSEANIGFTTDAGVGWGVRWGRLVRPWHTFNPHPAEYISIGVPPANDNRTTNKRETYLYAGATLRYRLYNAILQGQFRDSAVSFDFDQLNPVVGEAWAGFLTEFRSGYRFGLFVRGRTAELSKDVGRNPVWGGILISRSLR